MDGLVECCSWEKFGVGMDGCSSIVDLDIDDIAQNKW